MPLTETPPVPPFRLMLPAGWEELPADRTSIAVLIERSSALFASQHRPDLDVEFRRMLETAYRKMQQGRVFALYLQTTVPAERVLPLSITAAVADGQLGGTLDRQVTALFTERGAEFLTDDRTILRWQADAASGGELAGTRARVVNYLIPVPGTGRRSALVFTTTIPYPTEEDDGFRDAFVDELCLLSDTIVSTFAWEPAS
jgi:hypothetical protein